MTHSTARFLGIPYGTWVHLSWQEACTLTSPGGQAIIGEMISIVGGPYSAIISFAIDEQLFSIASANENSGGKGVSLLFFWALGMITDIEQRGSGYWPCGSKGTYQPTGIGGGGGGGRPPIYYPQ